MPGGTEENGLKNIYTLTDCHRGADIWIVAAGPTMDYVSPEFFENKISIGVNQVSRKFKTTWLVRKESALFDEARESGIPLIVSRYDCGSYPMGLNPEGDYVFDHLDNGNTQVDLSVIEQKSDKIVVSYSTITSAIHIAAVMGAKNIILCGHDCSTLDGKARMEGYNEPVSLSDQGYRQWLGEILPQTLAVREKIRTEYGCGTYSLNPFLGLAMEGHTIGD